MDLKIVSLETGIENALKESELPPEVKRLILAEIMSKMSAEANAAIKEQIKEVQTNAESV